MCPETMKRLPVPTRIDEVYGAQQTNHIRK